MASLIATTGLEKHYRCGDEDVAALAGVDLQIAAGEFVTVMGPSGSGKSTLLTILGGMNHPSAGSVTIAGTPLYALPAEELADFRAANLGFVFQAFYLLPYLNAMENVMLPLAPLKLPRREKERLALSALERVGLAEKQRRLPNQLSGGEQERVAIARAIVNRPRLILADEPTGSLDSATGATVMALFAELNAAGETIVMVTHNPESAACGQRTIHLKDGRVLRDEKNR